MLTRKAEMMVVMVLKEQEKITAKNGMYDHAACRAELTEWRADGDLSSMFVLETNAGYSDSSEVYPLEVAVLKSKRRNDAIMETIEAFNNMKSDYVAKSLEMFEAAQRSA